jgi:hypothetical protein
MEEIIIKVDVFSHDSNLIPFVRWLFPECRIHPVPSEDLLTHMPNGYSSLAAAVMEEGKRA